MERQEGLWEPSRQRRTFLISLTLLIFPIGAIILVASFLPSASQSLTVRLGFALFGVLLIALSGAVFYVLVKQGSRVGAVYGIKAAQRAGLVPPPVRRGASSGEGAGATAEGSSPQPPGPGA